MNKVEQVALGLESQKLVQRVGSGSARAPTRVERDSSVESENPSRDWDAAEEELILHPISL